MADELIYAVIGVGSVFASIYYGLRLRIESNRSKEQKRFNDEMLKIEQGKLAAELEKVTIERQKLAVRRGEIVDVLDEDAAAELLDSLADAFTVSPTPGGKAQ